MAQPTVAALLSRFSRAEVSALEVRNALGGMSYGDILRELARHQLPLPRAPQAGREDRIEAARSLLFPKAA